MVRATGARRGSLHHWDAVKDDNDDEGAARVLGVLADPRSLRLLLHVLQVGECDSTVGGQLDMTPRTTAAHLERLVEAGLLVHTQRGPGARSCRVSDAATVERLLVTVRQLGIHTRDA
jgi:DNA-binding transcriptional ArsR family regulator